MTFLLAEAEGGGGSGIGALFTALGLNVPALILNGLAFLIVVAILGKWVYPYLIKALDAKKDELEAAARHEREAKAQLEKAQNVADDLLAQARTSADEIISNARADAASQLDEARQKAAAQAERIVTEAREQLARDVRTAQQELRADTAKLVASATETILGEKLDDTKDAALINRSLEAK